MGEEKKKIKKLGVHDSINHALFISQSVMELLMEKGIITKEEVREKYNEMLEGYYEAMSECEVAVTTAEEAFKNFIKGGGKPS